MDVNFELRFRKRSALMIYRLSCLMNVGPGLVELHVITLDLNGFTLAIEGNLF